jgi:hypothetical protein
MGDTLINARGDSSFVDGSPVDGDDTHDVVPIPLLPVTGIALYLSGALFGSRTGENGVLMSPIGGHSLLGRLGSLTGYDPSQGD